MHFAKTMNPTWAVCEWDGEGTLYGKGGGYSPVMQAAAVVQDPKRS